MALTDGMDVERVREIAGQLKTEAGKIGEVEQNGTSQVSALAENWLGTDSEAFATEWQTAQKQLQAATSALEGYAQKAEHQAQQQEGKSEAKGN